MVMVEIQGEQRYFDGYLKDNLETLKEAVKLNWDGLIYVFGYEGDGKTTLAAQIASYLDPGFSLSKMCWTPQQFMDVVMSAERYSCVVLDEAYLSFVNKGPAQALTKAIIAMLTQIRKKNLYILIVSPTFFDLNKYLVMHRSRAAIRVYAHGLQRGFFAMYGRDAKHDLYIKGHREHNMSAAQPDFRGRFTKWVPYDQADYEQLKDEGIRQLSDMFKDKEQAKPETFEQSFKKQIEIVEILNRNKFLKDGAIDFLTKHFNTSRSSFLLARKNSLKDLSNAPATLQGLKTEFGAKTDDRVVS